MVCVGLLVVLYFWFLFIGVSFEMRRHADAALPHKDAADEREFQNVYQTISKTPDVYTGTGAPSKAPVKIGDFYISTSTSKVYIATATATSGSWAILN